MPWLYLSLGIFFSVISTICTKLSHGATRAMPMFLWLVFQVATFFCLARSMKHINMSVIYALWCGVGMILIEATDVLVFSQAFSWTRIFYMFVIMIGIIG